ncbi:MAG: DNA-processing protein DprA [Bacteroidetes bacterium]|nr:DNA-processing protein DprA [Bacteroidota bacterium]
MGDVRTILRLLSIQGIGPQKIRALAKHFTPLEQIFSVSPLELMKVPGIDKTLTHRILQREYNDTVVDEQLLNAERYGIHIISLFDPIYPSRLKNIYDPPVLLFVKGSINTLEHPTIAIVGTRHPTQYGKRVTERFTQELVERNFCIVSGLARGIDTLAHTIALKVGGTTCAVLGSGIDVTYPPENAMLQHKISDNGVVISEYLLGTKPDASNFPRRNRIISGISIATIIVESDIDGGAMITATFANDQNRDVFAVPGSIFESKSAGPHYLIRENRAKLVSSVQEIINELNVQLSLPLKEIRQAPPPLSEIEQKLYALLTPSPQHIDVIAEIAGLSTSDTLTHLLTLEFKNLVQQLPGKYFVKVD